MPSNNFIVDRRGGKDFEFSVEGATSRVGAFDRRNGDDIHSSFNRAERFRPSSVPEIPQGIAPLSFLLLPRFVSVTHNEMTE